MIPTRALALLCALAATGAGCRFEDRYLLDRTAVDVVRQLSWKNRQRVAVPAVRVRDDAVGRLRGDLIHLTAPLPDDDKPIEVRAGGVNRVATGGLIAGLAGAVVLAAGGALLADERSHGREISAGFTVMLFGGLGAVTGLAVGTWGATHPPQEVPRDATGMIFLDQVSAREPERPAARMWRLSFWF